MRLFEFTAGYKPDICIEKADILAK